MSPIRPPSAIRPRSAHASQRGVVLLFALISLLVLMIGATALIRSFNTSLFMAGNIGFKRDLQNQGERAIAKLTDQFNTGAPLSTRALRGNDNLALNYSAQILQNDAQGVPLVLTRTDKADPGRPAFVLGAADIQDADAAVTIRYVIDRLCASSGDEKVLGATGCAVASTPSVSTSGSTQVSAESQSVSRTASGSGSTGTGQVTAVPQSVLYRLSVRVTGPRNTQSFFQSTFTVTS